MVKRKVQGSATQAKPLIIGKDTVYIHTNIVQLKDEDGQLIEDLFEYDEEQYTKDEYIEFLSNNQTVSVLDNHAIGEVITDLAMEVEMLKMELKQGGKA